jgi:hypothetical protein
MFFKIILIILMILFIVSCIIYFIYNYKRVFIINSPTYMGSVASVKQDEQNEKGDNNEGIDEYDSYYDTDFVSNDKEFKHVKLSRHHNDYNYSYTFFIKINNLDYRYNKIKEVFSKGSRIHMSKGSKDANGEHKEEGRRTDSSHNPRVMLAKQTNDMIIEIQTYDKKERFIVENIPLQTWIFMGIVMHNKTVDVYMNGSLYRSFTLKNLPSPSKHVIRYGNHGGFDGSLNQLVYYFRALSSLEILDLFNKNKGSLNNSIDTKQESIDNTDEKKVQKEIDSCYS